MHAIKSNCFYWEMQPWQFSYGKPRFIASSLLWIAIFFSQFTFAGEETTVTDDSSAFVTCELTATKIVDDRSGTGYFLVSKWLYCPASISNDQKQKVMVEYPWRRVLTSDFGKSPEGLLTSNGAYNYIYEVSVADCLQATPEKPVRAKRLLVTGHQYSTMSDKEILENETANMNHVIQFRRKMTISDKLDYLKSLDKTTSLHSELLLNEIQALCADAAITDEQSTQIARYLVNVTADKAAPSYVIRAALNTLNGIKVRSELRQYRLAAHANYLKYCQAAESFLPMDLAETLRNARELLATDPAKKLLAEAKPSLTGMSADCDRMEKRIGEMAKKNPAIQAELSKNGKYLLGYRELLEQTKALKDAIESYKREN